MRETVLTPAQMIDSVKVEFATELDPQKLGGYFGLFKYACLDVCFASVRYRTQDPHGREVIASGLIAYPASGSFRGVVEVAPYAREKHLCGSRRNFSVECLISARGFVSLIPDTIGYGSTEDVPIALLLSENTARVTADLRLAAAEFLASRGRRKMPRNSTLFGYSLGAPGALATAILYQAHPEWNVKVTRLILGSGAYDPALAIRHTLESGDCGFLLYPSIALSLNYWKDLGIPYDKLLQGDVLRDFERITAGVENLRILADEYGHDPRGYLHPSFFTEEGSPEIRRLSEMLGTLSVPTSGDVIPKSAKVYLRHSATDNFVPVECSDSLYSILRENGIRVRYRRDADGDHYAVAARTLISIFFILIP